MTAEQYLKQILLKYAVDTGVNSPARSVGNKIYQIIKDWGGSALKEVLFSGSFAKGTAVKGGTDVDLFISLNSMTGGTLQEIYDCLYAHLYHKKFAPKKQNVSIGMVLDGIKIDLIPAKKIDNDSDDHNLWKNRENTWTKTNISKHISKIKNSGRLNEIKLTKIWRNQNKLDFPSIYLELFVIDVLYGKSTIELGSNMLTILESLSTDLKTKKLIDPSNSNNIISDNITDSTKSEISSQATSDISKTFWEDIIN